MNWSLPDTRIPVERLGTLSPYEVLYEFDGPLVFTTLSPTGGKFLAYASFCVDEEPANATTELPDSDGFTRYLISPTSDKLLERLKKGATTLYDALDQPILWAVDIAHSGEVVRAAELGQLSDVPANCLPARNRTLWPHLMPLLSYRLIGDGLREGEVPASVVSRAVDGATSALKKLIEVVRNVNQSTGRPTDSHRRDYDLTAQRFAFNSFEVAFASGSVMPAPANEDPAARYTEAGMRLQEALDWLVYGYQYDEDPTTDMLDVLNRLVPPSQGVVRETEIAGRLLPGSAPYRLTRTDATRVRSAITRHRLRKRDLLESEGRVRELDLDEFTFILRDRNDGLPELRCSFIELLLDDVSDAFNGAGRVVVQGRLDNRGQLDVSAIQTLATNSPADHA
ncbi:hypothetical protein [Hydrogenophaga sp. RWCD_12]|uniref:hypothetical protein n=1 Tax=Hydrogenophaga sp. RWCD_12 TaxID=3391190 RepID=UPI00398503A6